MGEIPTDSVALSEVTRVDGALRAPSTLCISGNSTIPGNWSSQVERERGKDEQGATGSRSNGDHH